MEYVRRMNRVEKRLLLGLGGLLLAVVLRADVKERADHPYQVIIDRNAFGLKTPPQVVNPTPTNPVVPVNVKFCGVSANSTGKKAWLMIPAQPGKNPNPQYLNGLAEHEKQGDIEVLEINLKESKVKILNAGALVELNIKDNGLPTPLAQPVPGVPLNPRGVIGVLPTPGLVPPPGTLPSAFKTAGAMPNGGAASDALAAGYGPRTIPRRNLRTEPIEQPVQAAQAPVDPAVQRIMMEAQKQQAEAGGKPFPPLPPLPGNAAR